MGRRERVRIEYTVGERGIEAGESIEIWKHFTSDVEEFQITDPSEPAYFDAETTAAGVTLERKKFINNIQRNKMSVFPYRKTASVTISGRDLAPGEKVYFDLGGEQGVRMQYYQENLFNFRIAITDQEEKRVLGYAGDAVMKIVGGPAVSLAVKAPAIVSVGESFAVEVVPRDAWGSLAKDYQGLELEMDSGSVGGSRFHFDDELQHYVAAGVTASGVGTVRIRVRSKDGALTGVSNPIWIERNPERRVFFGDLHQHTYLADGRGAFEELYLYARRVAMLDFGALTPHQDPLGVSGPLLKLPQRFPQDNWPALQRANRIMAGWKGFTPILGYEYSVGTASGGHHNVFYAEDDAPSTMQLAPEKNRVPVGEMMQLLRLSGERALVIPHIGGGPPDWEHPTDPRLERLFEIASVHGVFEESYQKHLESGQRLAATASGDTHTTSFGNANPGLIYTMTNPLTAILAPKNDREALFGALYARQTYGVTGNTRLLMDFWVNGASMGGEVPRYEAETARVSAKVSGTAPILRVDLVRNGETIHSATPAVSTSSDLLRIKWGDNLYQRRANVGLSDGELRAASGRLRLDQVIDQDNSFETFQQSGDLITWRSATTSNDRDGLLVDISEAAEALILVRDDPNLGRHEVRIPLSELRRNGTFRWQSQPIESEHRYMRKMGVPELFTVECELIAPDAPLDVDFQYEDRRKPEPGDYYYLRVEQTDTVLAWSSPVWFN